MLVVWKEETGEEPLGKSENKEQTQSRKGTELEPSLGQIGGRWALSLQCHSCSHILPVYRLVDLTLYPSGVGGGVLG